MSYRRTLVGLKPPLDEAPAPVYGSYRRTLVGLKLLEWLDEHDIAARYRRTLVGLKHEIKVLLKSEEFVTDEPLWG